MQLVTDGRGCSWAAYMLRAIGVNVVPLPLAGFYYLGSNLNDPFLDMVVEKGRAYLVS